MNIKKLPALIYSLSLSLLIPASQALAYNFSIFHTLDSDFNGTITPSGQLTVANNSVALTSMTCGDNFQKNHTVGVVAPVDKTVTYGTVASTLGGTGNKCWITRNLGADQQATSATDATEPSAGWFWQFNRKQGYKENGLGTIPSWTITAINENSNWASANDPCTLLLGTDWRLPTSAELTNAKTTAGWANYNDTYASIFKLHAAGFLTSNNGRNDYQGQYGRFWSSNQGANTTAYLLHFYNTGCIISNFDKAQGYSLRCIKDSLGLGYYPTGTYTSPVLVAGGASNWGTIAWTRSGTGTITMKARSCVDINCTGATAWTSCGTINSGDFMDWAVPKCVTNLQRFIQYQATLTGDTTTTPSLDSVTLTYDIIPDAIFSGGFKFLGSVKIW